MKKPREMQRILIANRGEIALRVIRAVREAGLESIAVYSDADSGSPQVRLADRAIRIGPGTAKESYLNIGKIIDAAHQTGADAIHPGYGFLAENDAFADAVEEAGLIFIGPRPQSIRDMALKDEARKKMAKAGVPIVPGSESSGSFEELEKTAAKIGYPVMLKAAAGGSGRGMRVVEKPSDLRARLEEAEREAEAGFGNKAVFVEKFIATPRHIEVQVFGDEHGNAMHFGERDCTLQRRHQKVVEEAPAAKLHPALRDKICTAALRAAESVSYRGAGTVEFLVEGGEREDDLFYFLEMNTRIQVEHPVTEVVWGVDLVRLQLDVARGVKLDPALRQLTPRGHAFEFRIYAEDPAAGFRPAIGRVAYIARPGGPGVREDGWVEPGSTISPFYDSLLSKLIVHAADRASAIERARSVLREMIVEGMPTTLGFHRWVLDQPDFLNLDIHVRWIEQAYQGQIVDSPLVGPLVVEQAANQ